MTQLANEIFLLQALLKSKQGELATATKQYKEDCEFLRESDATVRREKQYSYMRSV